uniref:Putative secreted peptide n=1 Tax=Anopheles braziliensis TaxID=58242 RepID=A0A2M3ZPP5_9DIPT
MVILVVQSLVSLLVFGWLVPGILPRTLPLENICCSMPELTLGTSFLLSARIDCDKLDSVFPSLSLALQQSAAFVAAVELLPTDC